MTNVLEISNLGGGYNRRKIIDNVNIQIPKGSITALIGLNGAGKSTTIKHILGLLRPMEGEIKVNGITITRDNEKYRKSISYIPESPVLYEELTLEEVYTNPTRSAELQQILQPLNESLEEVMMEWEEASLALEEFQA